MEADYERLRIRASECIEALFAIESDVFAFSLVDGGKIRPTQPLYWHISGDGLARVYVRGT